MHTWKKPCSTWDQPWRRCRRRCVTPSSRFYWVAWSIFVRDDEGPCCRDIVELATPIIRVLKGIGNSNIEIMLSIGRLSCFCSTDLYPLPSRCVSILMGSTWQFSLCRCAIYTFFRFPIGLILWSRSEVGAGTCTDAADPCCSNSLGCCHWLWSFCKKIVYTLYSQTPVHLWCFPVQVAVKKNLFICILFWRSLVNLSFPQVTRIIVQLNLHKKAPFSIQKMVNDFCLIFWHKMVTLTGKISHIPS